MNALPKRSLTETEYLARERNADFRSEFYRGEMFAMAGASREHLLIAGNIARRAGNVFEDRPCEVYQADMRVKIRSSGLYTYPDVVIVCGEPRFEDGVFDTLINPTVLFEVLSESTEAYDRGFKSAQYRSIPSLKEYVLVSQTEARCDRFVRQPDGSWLLRDVTGLDGTLHVEAVDLSLPMADIYRRVELPAPRLDHDFPSPSETIARPGSGSGS
jgi:Uma2 family endonuclease